MTPKQIEAGAVVRILNDRLYGWAPIGSVDQIVGDWARIALDEPERWNREHSWFMLDELEVVDIGQWEKAVRDAA